MAEGGEETDDEQDVRYCPKEKGREGRLHMIRKVGQIRRCHIPPLVIWYSFITV
ncbi:hypothetical protein SLEP1_g53263 [Rubroshorea leprosula]|uniref:Uncharacterized protein n=1 Tax=Rubroshorea leprosula TaxID=152421 RepID=A0AAV5M8X2_9ROSI|nr:hypothetical protein SLEP1_g53263 [Rubroshorea leprosula]